MISLVRELVLRLLATLGLYNKKGTLVLLGLDNAGKSTLLHRLTSGEVTSLPPTERPNMEQFQLGGITFKAWDLGGHEAVRHLWGDFMGDSQAVVFMVDAADSERLEEAHWELCELMTEGPHADVPVAVLYNKCDLPSALSDRQLHGQADWHRFQDRRPVRAFRTSVLQGTGYEEAFQWLGQFL